MRVLHVAEILPGGTASYLQELHKHQNQFGSDRPRYLLPAAQLHHVPSISQADAVGWNRSGRNLKSFLALGRSLLEQVAVLDPTIVHLHGTFAGFVGRLVLAFKPNRPKIVYCSHGWAFTMELPKHVKSFYGAIERLLSKVTDKIVVISEDEKSRAVAAGIPAHKMVKILNGVSEVDISPATKPNGGPLRLVFAGRHDRQKGLDILLQALELVPDNSVMLDVLGSRLDELGQPVSQADLNAMPNVRFVGWTDRRTAFQSFAEADAVVMPSRWEGFGLVAIEAFRAGTPVIGSDRGGLKEVIVHGVTGYLVQPDARSLSACLRSLERSTLRKMGLAAQVDFMDRFTATRMCSEIQDMYQSVLSPQGGLAHDHGLEIVRKAAGLSISR